MFSPQIVEWALPSTSEKQGNQKQQEAVVQEEEYLHYEEEREFDLVDLDVQYDHETSNLLIKEKYATIK